MEKINKAKSWFFERIVNKLWPGSQEEQVDPSKQSDKWKRRNTTEIQNILREYYEQLHANKLDKKKWTSFSDQFLETHSLCKLRQEETDNLNRSLAH